MTTTYSLGQKVRLPDTVAKRVRHGHLLESDPPATMTAAQRWTCTTCGFVVVRYGSNVYGSATERDCPLPSAMETTTTYPKGDSMSKFSHIQAGLLPSGTVTEFGTIVCSTCTAYEMTDGSFVAFRKVHGAPAPVMPLVVFG